MSYIQDIKTTLTKLGVYVDQLENDIEERDRLVHVLLLSPSSNDNNDMINLMINLEKYFTYLQDDLLRKRNIRDESILQEFKSLVKRYEQALEYFITDATIDISEYKFVSKELSLTKPEAIETSIIEPSSKSVRFQDEVEYQESRSDLMGTRTFNNVYSDSESFDNTNNQQLFAQHQQALLQQDEDLDILHESVRRQHSMGVVINEELDDHLIILNDLERGVDQSQLRLGSAGNRLRSFRQKCKENGSMITIVVLTIILVLLLVVLN
ncbi:uncharacterized protein KQ657_002525 [Scheffersomyces spartinae]|uniref:t-SNARE coiled-coil homology domain-containing protein n=1 Tax=Scheffersomyces spartinae TaxID=45513 RepID=A0A9P8AGV5_9ASCO|nr:uncharacterized protein KQ657_002525 [Scheffersomyces spartinae]KAG7192160.1 hypothetical protein KQ657_002525 [Scheffersomyces spartinae]